MTKVYACLVGNWVNLSDDPDCIMGVHRQSPYTWWKDGADIYSPYKKEEEHSLCYQDYIWISYKSVDYRIHPMFIQIVTT